MNDLRPYVCTFPNCSEAGETYVSRAAFVAHETRVHGAQWSQSKIEEPSLPKNCIFCGEMLPPAEWAERSRHIGRHMEEIAFMVVNEPYEDWEFYSDTSCAGYEVTDDPRNVTTSQDASMGESTTYEIRMQRVTCVRCTEKKTFSSRDALKRHARCPPGFLPRRHEP